jgi:hypothetical protein
MAEGPSYDDFVQVAESGQIFEAELMALRLRAHGLDVHVVDQTFYQEPLPNVRSFAVVRVLVPRAEADEARRILADASPLPEDVDPEGGGGPEVM